MQSLNYEHLFGKVGLETITFKSGQFKDMLSGSRELTQEERDYIQGMVMQTYGKFVGIVARELELGAIPAQAGLADTVAAKLAVANPRYFGVTPGP